MSAQNREIREGTENSTTLSKLEVLDLLRISEDTLNLLTKNGLLCTTPNTEETLYLFSEVQAVNSHRNPVAKNGLLLTSREVIRYLDIDSVFFNFLVENNFLKPLISHEVRGSWYFTMKEVGDFKRKHLFNQVSLDGKIYIPDNQAKARGYLKSEELASTLGVSDQNVYEATKEGRYTPVAHLAPSDTPLFDVVTYNQFELS